MALPNLSEWHVELLRITAFLQFNDRAKEETWWQQLFGNPPETRTVRANEGLLQDEGPFFDGKLTMAVRPGRIDWVWSVNPVIPLQNTTPPSLGNLTETTEQFKSKLAEWLGLAPPIARLAFGAILDMPVPGKIEAYKLLQMYLPAVKLFPENSSDFTYQINRPILSEVVQGYRINRLNKWAAIRATIMGLREGGQMVRNELFAARLEIDANTELEAAIPIPKEKNLPLLVELISAAHDIASKGDQPQ